MGFEVETTRYFAKGVKFFSCPGSFIPILVAFLLVSEVVFVPLFDFRVDEKINIVPNRNIGYVGRCFMKKPY